MAALNIVRPKSGFRQGGVTIMCMHRSASEQTSGKQLHLEATRAVQTDAESLRRNPINVDESVSGSWLLTCLPCIHERPTVGDMQNVFPIPSTRVRLRSPAWVIRSPPADIEAFPSIERKCVPSPFPPLSSHSSNKTTP